MIASSPLAPFPKILLTSRRFATEVSALQQRRVAALADDEDSWREQLPSIRMAGIMQMRSMAGALIHAQMPHVELEDHYRESGKVQFRCIDGGEQFLLKSDRFRQREMTRKINDVPFPGWDERERELVTAVFYRFDFGGRRLALSQAQVEVDRSSAGKTRYFQLEDARDLGVFDIDDDGEIHPVADTHQPLLLERTDATSSVFEQPVSDEFDELDLDEGFDEESGGD